MAANATLNKEERSMTRSKRALYTMLTVICIIALMGAIISLFVSHLFLLSTILWVIGCITFLYIGLKINPYEENFNEAETAAAIDSERDFMVSDAIMLTITFFLLLASLISWKTWRDASFADMRIGSLIVEKDVDVKGDVKVQGTLQVTDLDVTNANITKVNATEANITKVNATEVNATKVNATKVNATEVNATRVNATQLNVTKANIDTGFFGKIFQKGDSEPVTKAPVTQKPVTQAPVTQKPITQAPVTQKPVTQAPVTQAPTQAPTTTRPTTTQPATTQPTTQPTTEPTTQAPSFRSSGRIRYGQSVYVTCYNMSTANVVVDNGAFVTVERTGTQIIITLTEDVSGGYITVTDTASGVYTVIYIET